MGSSGGLERADIRIQKVKKARERITVAWGRKMVLRAGLLRWPRR